MRGDNHSQKIVEERKQRLLPWIAEPFKHEYPDYEPAQTTSGGQKVDTQHVEYPSRGPMTAQEVEEREEEMEEATPIELFYDLFFVANLTTVTGVHYITEKSSKMIAPLLLLTYGEFIFL